MSKLQKSAAIALLTLALSACSSNNSSQEESLKKQSPEALYSQSRTSMELGNYNKAVQLLEALDSRYPFGPHKTQVQLDLIYAYYKLKDPASGLANIDRFLRLNPTHDDIDYVQYMRGLVNMQSDEYSFHEMIGIDRADRDPEFAIMAFKDFERLIKRYPDSKYVADAEQRMKYLKERLAKYSLSVAQYYLKMNAWTAAANRAQLIVEHYPNTPQVEDALEIMLQAYQALGQETLAANTQAVLTLNYPDRKSVV